MYTVIFCLEDYIDYSASKRIDIIWENYATFNKLMEALEDCLVNRIAEEKSRRRRNNLEDLGVRVKTNQGTSNPTCDAAIESAVIRSFIRGEGLPDALTEDTEDPDEIIRMVLGLRQLKMEYSVFSKMLDSIRLTDHDVILQVINRKTTLDECADQLGITYDSAKQKVSRAKKKLKAMICPVMRA